MSTIVHNPINWGSIYVRPMSTTPTKFEMQFEEGILFKDIDEAQEYLENATNPIEAEIMVKAAPLFYKKIIDYFQKEYALEWRDIVSQNPQSSCIELGYMIMGLIKDSPKKSYHFNKNFVSFKLVYEEARAECLKALQDS